MWLKKTNILLRDLQLGFPRTWAPWESRNQGHKVKLEIARTPSSSGRSPGLSLKPRVVPGLSCSLRIYTSCHLPEELPSPHTFLLQEFNSLEIPWLWRDPSTSLFALFSCSAYHCPTGSSIRVSREDSLGPAYVFMLDHIMGSFQIRSMSSPLRVTAENIFSVPGVLSCPQTTERWILITPGAIASHITVYPSYLFLVFCGVCGHCTLYDIQYLGL